jgi:hypothetical protein
MSQIVKCDICGKIYSQSYLGSHKRLSHGKRHVVPRSSTDESAMMEAILSLFESLPQERKKEVLSRLAASGQTKL